MLDSRGKFDVFIDWSRLVMWEFAVSFVSVDDGDLFMPRDFLVCHIQYPKVWGLECSCLVGFALTVVWSLCLKSANEGSSRVLQEEVNYFVVLFFSAAGQ